MSDSRFVDVSPSIPPATSGWNAEWPLWSEFAPVVLGRTGRWFAGEVACNGPGLGRRGRSFARCRLYGGGLAFRLRRARKSEGWLASTADPELGNQLAKALCLRRQASGGCRSLLDHSRVLLGQGLKRNPHGGDLFVFRGRAGSLIKIIWHDGIGMSLYAKRLEKGRFVWPSASEGTVSLTPSQLACLLEGIDWRNPQYTWRPQSAG